MSQVVHLLPREVAERLRLSVGTLANFRCTGEGPRYVKLGRKILYLLDELQAWERSRLRSAVSAGGGRLSRTLDLSGTLQAEPR